LSNRNEERASNRKAEAMSRRAFLEFSGSSALLAAGGLLAQAGRAYPAETGRKIRMGVVGGGFGATFHWHEHPDCVVTGVTDLRPERRDRLRKYYRCDKAYDSLEEMVRQAKDIDAVAVFSGAPDHAKHVRMCMERGWHIVSAVPACASLEEAPMLIEVMKKTGRQYMMAESSYYRQECIFARNLYRAGGFGEIFYSEVEYYHDRGDLKTLVSDKKSRFYMPDGSRSWRWGSPPMGYPTHSLGFLVGVTGERIRKVSCLGWRGQRDDLRDHPYVADNAYKNPFWNEASMMLTDQGNMCRCNVFWLCAAGGERAQWFGDKASLFMPNGGVNQAVQKIRTKEEGGEVEIPEYWKSDMLPEVMRHASGHGGSAVFISAEFINALLEDRRPVIDLYESLAMTVPGIVAHQSALKDGEQLAVPQFDPKKV
jgi:predicted dehydrogenase